MKDNKARFEEPQKKPEKDYSLEDYKDFQRRMKTIAALPKEEKKQEKKEEPKARRRQEQKQERKQETIKPRQQSEPSAEEVFGFSPGQIFSKEDLKKRYLELLKQNHPDKVAQLSPDFKKLAEQKTKDINQAYAKLKNKAA